MPDPSPDDSRLLEPSNTAYELTLTTDQRIDQDIDESLLETENDSEFKAKKLGIGFWICIGWLALVTLLAIFAPLLQSWGIIADPYKLSRNRFAPPGPGHWLGTDDLGRDELSRLIFGGRVSLSVGFASIALGLVVGTTMGLLAGYMKGWVDNVLMTAVDIILAFPALLLAMAIITFTDSKDIAHISLAIGIVAVPSIARLVRANTLSFREREFVLASRTLGASHARVLTREILPNVVPPVLSFAVIGVAVAIAAESGLAFVGISVPLPTPTWGGMINDARQHLSENPQLVIIPCTVLVLTIMSLYFAGDRLRQYFDVKESVL